MHLLIVMTIFSPSHFWNENPITTITGWNSMTACNAAIPYFQEKYGAYNDIDNPKKGFNPFSSEPSKIRQLVPATVECKAFNNE